MQSRGRCRDANVGQIVCAVIDIADKLADVICDSAQLHYCYRSCTALLHWACLGPVSGAAPCPALASASNPVFLGTQ